MWLKASRAEPSTTSSTQNPMSAGPRVLLKARSVTMAPPRLWPIRIIGGRDGQDMVDSVRWIMVSASWERLGMEKSMISSWLPLMEVTIEPPWPLASRLRIPASGNLCLTC